MELTIEYQNGIYTGEVKDGIPHGYGTLKISDSKTFEGYWKEGKRHGAGHYSQIWTRDYDGLECKRIHHRRGIWTDDDLSGVVWEYWYEEDMSEKTTESCVFEDKEYGLALLGFDRNGKLIGVLAEPLESLNPHCGRRMLCQKGNRSWGKLIRDGHTFIGQFSSENESPYYADDYIPHGFCIELKDDELIYCGMFDMGKRKGPGVIPSTDTDCRFAMNFQII